jgi:hypothetical protein
MANSDTKTQPRDRLTRLAFRVSNAVAARWVLRENVDRRRWLAAVVIALSTPVPFHLGKVKSSTSTLTRSF